MTITIIGASGFIGQHLIRHLLATTDYQIRAFCRSAGELNFEEDLDNRVTLVPGSVFKPAELAEALSGADVAVYLVHMMQTHRAYVQAETRAAHAVVKAGLKSQLPRLIYLGGLGNEAERLSPHLLSRHHTGEILRSGLPLVLEFQASMVVGTGSVGFEVVRTLAAKLPIMAVPHWAVTEIQPLGLSDVLRYLTASLSVDLPSSEIVEIGGSAVVTYPMLLARYAKHVGRPGIAITVPFVPVKLATWWLGHYMDRSDGIIAGAMVESLHNSMVVRSTRSLELFPDIHPRPFEESF